MPGMTFETGPIIDQQGGNLVLDVFVLDRHIGALLDLALRGTGISPAQYAVYSQIGRGARTSPGQLVDVLGLRPATLSGDPDRDGEPRSSQPHARRG